jgi:hypothetical protein
MPTSCFGTDWWAGVTEYDLHIPRNLSAAQRHARAAEASARAAALARKYHLATRMAEATVELFHGTSHIMTRIFTFAGNQTRVSSILHLD